MTFIAQDIAQALRHMTQKYITADCHLDGLRAL